MGTVLETIVDYSPADESVGVPLLSQVSILFDRALSEESLEEQFFVEGPDTDTFVGPGFNLLEFPDNVSQGDDFLTSPGYHGIVQGEYTFEHVDPDDPEVTTTGEDYRTRLIFTPSHPLAALTEYTAHLPQIEDDEGELLFSGYVTFSWTTGTGSIAAIPSTSSSSALAPGSFELEDAPEAGSLSVVSTSPANHSIEVDPETGEITITFDKEIDPSSVDADRISVITTPATDHPKASSVADGELAKSVEVQGNKLIIRI